MLALAGANAFATATFAALYVAAGARLLGQAAFVASLVISFVGFTALWLQVERTRPGSQDLAGRVGRIAVGFALVVVGFPALALMPLFSLREQLPPEAGLDPVLPGAMVAVLAALALTAGVNAAGIACGLAAALARWFGRRA